MKRPTVTLEDIRRLSCAGARGTTARVERYLLELHVEAARQKRAKTADQWAQQELDDCTREGARKSITQWVHDSNPSPRGGTKVGGVFRRTATGRGWEQAEFQSMSREELVAYREMAVRQRGAWSEKITLIDKHIKLLDRAPMAATPAAAAEQLGLDLDEFLAGAA